MNRLIKPSRVTAMAIFMGVLLVVYLAFLYRVQIVEGEEYYTAGQRVTQEERTVTAARGSILDRYGRVLVSNKECYNLTIDVTKLFADEDPNAALLELVELVEQCKADSEETESLLRNILSPYVGQLDAIVLGCTHYPLIAEIIASILPNVTLISSGAEAAREMVTRIGPKTGSHAPVHYYVSDDPALFTASASQFLDCDISGKVEKIDIERF